MIDRRQFIQASAASAALVGVAAAAASHSIRAEQGLHPDLAVIDVRFPESRNFGRALQRRGVTTHETRGDVTDLWYHTLHSRWSHRVFDPIAGLTAYSALFCLERLAWDHGMRVVYRELHWNEAASYVHGSPSEAAERVMALGLRQRRTQLAITPINAELTKALQSRTERTEPVLYSWVIARPLPA